MMLFCVGIANVYNCSSGVVPARIQYLELFDTASHACG